MRAGLFPPIATQASLIRNDAQIPVGPRTTWRNTTVAPPTSNVSVSTTRRSSSDAGRT